jgi:hypothetical protein
MNILYFENTTYNSTVKRLNVTQSYLKLVVIILTYLHMFIFTDWNHSLHFFTNGNVETYQ